MKNLILELRNQGKTILMCSHRLEDVQDVCDRIAILFDGELQELGSVDKLLEVEEMVQLTARGIKITDALRHDLSEIVKKHGGSVDNIDHPTTTLEDLFLRIVEDSKARPGRRYMPPGEQRAVDQKA